MPKIKKRSADSANVLSSRDVSKIRKLMRKNADDEKPDISKSINAALGLESNSEESEVEEEFQLDLPNFDISEDMSQYTGSVIGDLDAVRGFDDLNDLPEELKDHLNLLTDVLKHYRSGPLPKTLKMLPHLIGWESLLEMLKPLEWSVHVYPRIVRVFASKGHEPAHQ
ncbi:unnamed protein product [Trichobilharzia regenti]|nr:unnamed protein product [Trichobilharzia regenti]